MTRPLYNLLTPAISVHVVCVYICVGSDGYRIIISHFTQDTKIKREIMKRNKKNYLKNPIIEVYRLQDTDTLCSKGESSRGLTQSLAHVEI